MPITPSQNPAERIVHQDHFDVSLGDNGIVWLQRNDVIYPSVTAVHEAYDAFLALVDDWLLDRRIKSGELGTKAKTQMAWIYDVRGAPQRRNDPAFEEVVQKRRPDLLQRSPILAVLVKTASGKMQVSRLARTGGADLMILDDPNEAVALVLERMRQPSGFPSKAPST
jgi:hypothetical protein